MNITTTARDFEMSRAIDSFAREQLDAMLQPFSDSIVSIDVFMKDANGPKGGIDKEVLIRVHLRNRSRRPGRFSLKDIQNSSRLAVTPET